jgi:hypothetical protein
VVIRCYPWPSIRISFPSFLQPKATRCKSAIQIHRIRKDEPLLCFRLNWTLFAFRASSFSIEDLSISYEKAAWYEYFKCGIQGIRDKYPELKLKGSRTHLTLLCVVKLVIGFDRYEGPDSRNDSSQRWSIVVVRSGCLCCSHDGSRERYPYQQGCYFHSTYRSLYRSPCVE